MAPSSYEMAASTLLCGEASSSILDLEAVAQEEEEVLLARSRTRREPSVVFPVPSEDCVAGTCYLGFRPSEIAAAVDAAVAGEEHAVDIDKACTHHVHEERVSRCLEAIQATVALLALGTVPAQPLKAEGPSSGHSRASSSSATVPRSPTGVLDAGCLSYRSDDVDGRSASCALRPLPSPRSALSAIARASSSASMEGPRVRSP
ncbi:hypothetical protein ZEAMMB73_Zm00001d032050 [Zea mays]|uniref:Uncharacterized protein n=1 Tax=Zea mays TaxID=4577 RepID=A0A1D6KNA5_MAIZE|nr:hypothetical protein ZEAMMB73_Zm00001d032050 [Zea mays]